VLAPLDDDVATATRSSAAGNKGVEPMSQADANRAAGSTSSSSPGKPDAPKAGGFLGRFFHRKPSEEDQSGEKPRVPRVAADKKPLAGDGFPTIVRKISRKEETAIKISEGLNELSQLMRCVGEQLDTHHEERVELNKAMVPLQEFLSAYPRAAEQSAEALEAIRSEVVEQGKNSRALLDKVSDLPEAIRELPVVGKQQVTLLQGVLRNAEEHNRKLTELLATVESATSRNVEAIHDLKELQQDALEVMTRTQQETYKEFDRRNNRQQKDLASMISRTNRHHAVLMVVFLLVTLFAVSLAALLSKPGSNQAIEATRLSPPGGVTESMDTGSGR
jgi:hypothetical protein